MGDDTCTVTNGCMTVVRHLSFQTKVAYGIGHVLNDICASIWFTYLLVFFHFVLGFNAFLAGLILLIGQVADAFATPFIGFHCDKNDDFWLCRYGKRKSWHLLGTICVLIAFPFVFTPCIGCERAHHWAQLIYYSAFVIIFQFGWAAVQISHLSLIPDLTPTEQERTELTAIRYSFTVFSNVLVYCATWAVLHITNNGTPDSQIGPNDTHKFQEIVFIGIGIGFIASIIFHVFVKEGDVNDVTGTVRRNPRSISMLFKDIRLYKVACVYMPTRLFVNLSQVYVPLYLHETLNMAATSLAIVPLTIFLSSFIMSLIIERLNTKLGRRASYFIGVLLGLSACAWIWFGKGKTYITYEIYPVAILLGAGGSVILVTSLGITADLIGHGTENGAFVYGIMSFSDKLSNGLAVILIQYMRNVNECPDYYKDILTFVCGGSAIFGLSMILCIKPFTYDNDYSTLESRETTEHIVPPISVRPSINENSGDNNGSLQQPTTA